MKDLDNELWKYGVPSKTKHNETAPGQHEIACIYRNVNITTDNNHLVMEVMQDVAKRHNLRCLLHEKPFYGINGSGKHNNWSVITDTNINLFKPGNDPLNNITFLATLACVIKGVDEYADLLRLSIATAGNDHRLGGHEAPPAIISMFLGTELDKVIDAIVNDKKLDKSIKNRFVTGVSVIPDFAKDNTDRNRTSPFAFTGNKFEFRGVGSSQSVALANTMLNTILSKEYDEMADLIEKGNKPMDVIKAFLNAHRRVIFNGDGYSSNWEKIAASRGLNNINNTVDAIKVLKDERISNVLISKNVLSKVEVDSRYEILINQYSKIIHVEALTALKMINNQIYPSCIHYLKEISKTSINLKSIGIENKVIFEDVEYLSKLLTKMKKEADKLEKLVKKAELEKQDILRQAYIFKDEVLVSMNKLRKITDEVEKNMDLAYWPIPTYTELLFGIE